MRHDVSIAPPVGPFGKTDSNTAFEVTPFIQATPDVAPTSDRLARLGTELGKMHNASLNFEWEGAGNNPGALMGMLRIGGMHGSRMLTGSAPAGFSYMKGNLPQISRNSSAALGALTRSKTLPHGVIHGDMNRYNVLWQGDTPVFLDFERARPSDFLYETAKAVNEFIIIPALETGASHDAIVSNMATFLNAYHQERPLTTQEVQTLPAMLRFGTMLAAAKQSAMGMGRRYPPLPQGTMLQNTIDDIARTVDFGALLDTPPVSLNAYSHAAGESKSR